MFFDEERYEQDQALKRLQSNVRNQLHDFADRFDKLFNNLNTQQNG